MRGSRLLRGRTVLVIEDDDDSRNVIRGLLESFGAKVDVAADGLEGLVQLERRRPDAVFCDLRMPVMDGIEFARRMRRSPRNRSVLLIAVTGHDTYSDFVGTWDAGFDGHLVKPLTPEALEAVARRVRQQSAASSGA